MVPFALGGMVIWAVSALVLLPFRTPCEAHGHGDWSGSAWPGSLVGIPAWR